MIGKQSCWNCTRSRIIKGRKIDEFTSEPDIVDCIEGKVDYNLLDKYKRNPIIMPKVCNHYDPELIEKCYYCGQEINKPVWNWPHWVDGVFDEWPVCNQECSEALQKELDESLEDFDIYFYDEEDDDWIDDIPF